jgi:hypothetical protein
MERTHLDDLRDEWKDARDDAIRHGEGHRLDCTCRGCRWDEQDDTPLCGYVNPRQGTDECCERPQPCRVHAPGEFWKAAS